LQEREIIILFFSNCSTSYFDIITSHIPEEIVVQGMEKD